MKILAGFSVCSDFLAEWKMVLRLKKCLKIDKIFFKVFQAYFKRCEIPIQWQSAQEVYIPKVSTSSDTKISDFFPIALLNVEHALKEARTQKSTLATILLDMGPSLTN